MNIGDLVKWPAGHCDTPGLILDKRPAKRLSAKGFEIAFGAGFAVLAMLPELGNDPEWFHERELEVVE
mgnify:FL=1|jgi:hypothetical protein